MPKGEYAEMNNKDCIKDILECISKNYDIISTVQNTIKIKIDMNEYIKIIKLLEKEKMYPFIILITIFYDSCFLGKKAIEHFLLQELVKNAESRGGEVICTELIEFLENEKKSVEKKYPDMFKNSTIYKIKGQ